MREVGDPRHPQDQRAARREEEQPHGEGQAVHELQEAELHRGQSLWGLWVWGSMGAGMS